MQTENAAQIAALNDRFRGMAIDVVVTPGVIHGFADVIELLKAVERFDTFTEDNDPHGEHDFGSFELEGDKLFWKIDYYDLAGEFGSEDPTDPKKTLRVLTVMLAEEIDLLLPAPRLPRGAFLTPKPTSPIELPNQIEQFLSFVHEHCI